MNKPILLIPIFLLAFVAIWLGVNLLLSVISGWRSLARQYRGLLPEAAAEISMASGMIRMVSYNHIINFTVGRHGIGMSLFPLFAVTSPPLSIPWQAIRDCRRYQLMGMFDRFSFRVAGVRVTASGAAARLLDDAWRQWGTEAPARQPAEVSA